MVNDTLKTYLSDHNISLLLWYTSLVCLIAAWNVCRFSRVFARVTVVVLLFKVLLSTISMLPPHLYAVAYLLNPSYIKTYAPPINPLHYHTSTTMMAVQLVALVFFTGLACAPARLADRFWMFKTILVDWVIVIIMLIVTSILDLTTKTSYFFVFLAYTMGANVGFVLMKMVELQWRRQSQYLDAADSVIFDTDAPESDEPSSSSSSTAPSQRDNVDYSKLTEQELNTILSSPSPHHQEAPADPLRVFINNLKAPLYVRGHLYSRELVVAISLLGIALSNYFIEYQTQIASWIMSFSFGVVLTLLSYYVSITDSSKPVVVANKKDM
ncbi:hypothetical protein SAMD00019534_019290 [Acytostelium subglobosum LB1]|uniref:hypothetical protein n=1 Tax=Acytostelium subglobosum LB1 TaxID=1410327 RepID=UPI000644F088|nr:hypothetical protein SAMD00019534_019290 [Acytostelium subglobosum LB1]GAM18754.1 hypothetical protein SAMD00019534_019290 [Acytostelium subglobosum LB1]|eukprot:XP_012757974.1 hypothetical protein SAMD00019534_019290 [Acytostelium subglobosum LB1]